MGEKVIELGGVNPIDIYGSNNKKLAFILSFFTKIKVVARGNTLKVIGEDADIDNFELKFKNMLAHFIKYQRLTNSNIERIILNHKLVLEGNDDVLVHGTSGKNIKAQTANQRKMVDAALKNDMLFAVGPAGTGKTYTAVAIAVKALKNKEVKRIILSRPAVEAGESLGFLPGDLQQKVDPYLRPLFDSLHSIFGFDRTNSLIDKGIIEVAPLAFMRGRTLDNSLVILDEAQNTTCSQMRMFLTRLGERSKMVVNGDITQIDLKKDQESGLIEASRIFSETEGIKFCYLTIEDVVRHPLVQKIIDAYK